MPSGGPRSGGSAYSTHRSSCSRSSRPTPTSSATASPTSGRPASAPGNRLGRCPTGGSTGEWRCRPCCSLPPTPGWARCSTACSTTSGSCSTASACRRAGGRSGPWRWGGRHRTNRVGRRLVPDARSATWCTAAAGENPTPAGLTRRQIASSCVELETAIDLDATTNGRVVLRRRPEGLLTKDDVELQETVPLSGLDDGEALLEVDWIGIDATVRTWLSKAEGYLPAVEIGEAVRASGIGRVVATRCQRFPLGHAVYGLPGWQRYGVVHDDPLATPVGEEVDAPALLAVYGATGLTAYVGMVDIGRVEQGQTVVVSAAAGATGSLAAQIARIHGCRVVGICGTDDKARWLLDDLGLDGAINHRTDDLHARLKELCPDRVDVYFDNVGGPILDAVLDRLAMHARVVCCAARSRSTTSRGVRPDRPTTSSSSTAGRRCRGSCRSTTGIGSRRWPAGWGSGWRTASSSTGPTSTRGWSRPSTPSTPCSPATTPARR